MPTIAEQLTQLESDRQDLVSNLQTKGITGLTGDETFTALVPEVLNIQTGGGSEDLDKLIDGSITSVTSSVTTVRGYTFYQRTSLTSASFSNATTIREYAFSGCTSLSSVSIPSVTRLYENSFRQCSGLTNISLPSVNNLGASSFYECTNLTTISVPNLTNAGDYVFYGCSSLVNVDLNTIPRLGYGVFGDCASLQSITLKNTSVVVMASSSSIPASSTQHLTIYVPSNLISSYQTATNWSTFYNNGYITFTAIPS